MQNPKFNLEIQNVIHSRKKPFDYQTLNHYSQGLSYFKIDLKKTWSLDIKRIIHPSSPKSECLQVAKFQWALCSVKWKTYLQVVIVEFGFKTSLDFGGWPLWVPLLLMCCKSCWALITLMLIHYLSCSKPQALKIHGITKKWKWTLKRRVVVMGISTIFLNFTKSLINNNARLNPIYYL